MSEKKTVVVPVANFTEYKMRKQGLQLVSDLGLRLTEGTKLFDFLLSLIENAQADYIVVKDAKTGALFKVPFKRDILEGYAELIDWLMTQKS